MNKFEIISDKQFEADNILNFDRTDVKLPQRATEISAGYDFFAPFPFLLSPGESIKVPTGIRVQLDPDKVLVMAPRSGHGFKYRLQFDNTIGIIDADYYNSCNEGHIWLKLTNDTHEDKPLYIEQGEAFGQGIILQYFLTVDDNAEGKRNGGFGSTTKK